MRNIFVVLVVLCSVGCASVPATLLKQVITKSNGEPVTESDRLAISDCEYAFMTEVDRIYPGPNFDGDTLFGAFTARSPNAVAVVSAATEFCLRSTRPGVHALFVRVVAPYEIGKQSPNKALQPTARKIHGRLNLALGLKARQ